MGVLKCKQEDKATEWLPIVISFWKKLLWCCSLVDVTPGLGWTTYIGALIIWYYVSWLMCIILYYVSWGVFFLCPQMFSIYLSILLWCKWLCDSFYECFKYKERLTSQWTRCMYGKEVLIQGLAYSTSCNNINGRKEHMFVLFSIY